MDSNYVPPSAEPPFDPDKYTPPSAEPPQIIDVNAKETPATPGFDAVPESLSAEPTKPTPELPATPPPPAGLPPSRGPAPDSGGMSSTTRTVLIIVAVVLVVLCCGCLLVALLGSWLYNNGDSILDRLSSTLPALNAWLA